MVNLVWSVLAKGRELPLSFSRKTSSVFKQTDDFTPIIDLLVPFGDNLFASFRIEQLVKLLLISDFRGRALELDTVNTYDKTVLSFPEPSATATPTPVDVLFFDDVEKLAEETEGIVSVDVDVDPGALSVTVEGETTLFTYVNNLSSLIKIRPARDIRLQGDLPALPFSFTVTYVAEPLIDWNEILERVNSRDYVFPDPDLRNVFREDPSWINHISSVIMNAVEGSI